jgi:hypothetical protein
MSPSDQSKLLAYVENGGCLIVGPGVPYLDAALMPASVLGQFVKQPGTVGLGKGQLIWAPTEAVPTIELPQPEYQCDQPAVEVTLLQRNGTTLLALANSAAQVHEAQMTFAGSRTFRPAWGEERVIQATDRTVFALPAYSVQIWEVT